MPSQLQVKKLTLFGVLPPQLLLAQLESGSIAEPSDREVLRREWERANGSYAQIGPPNRSFLTPDDLRALGGVDPARVQTLLQRAKSYPPHDSHTAGIYSARISKLVTPQIAINLGRAARRANINPGMTALQLFDLAFESLGQPEAIVRQVLGIAQNGRAIMFTSYDEDIRLHHPPVYRTIAINEGDPRSPEFQSVCIPVGGGLPFASAFRIQCGPGISRLILSNGIHRVYRLAQSGYEWCPLLVTDIIPLELGDPFVDLPRDVLLNPVQNPPLITDFGNNDVVISLTYHMVLKTLRLNWSFEQYATVLRDPAQS